MDTNDALIRSWDDWMRARNLSEATRYAYRYGLNRFLAEITPPRHVSQVTEQDVVIWLAVQTGKAKAQYMKGLRSFFGWASKHPEDSNVTTDPALNLRPKVPASPPPDCYSLGEVIALIHAAAKRSQRRADALQAIYGLGLRRTEMCRLSQADVDFELGRVTVWGKGDKVRFVPMPLVARDPLMRLCQNPANGTLLGVRPTRVSVWGTEAAQAAGIKRPYRSLHILRRSYATHLSDKGVDFFVISQLLGHSSPAVTVKYVVTNERKKAEAVQVLTLA